jgi:hypothetical protein
MGRTDPGTTAEWHELPHRSSFTSSLRIQHLGVFAPYLRITVHQVAIAGNNVALGYKNWSCLVWPTTDGKRSIPEGLSNHENAIWIKSMN